MANKGWRQIIAENETKTRWVITAFILTYIFIGLLIDIIFQSFSKQLNFGPAFWQLVSFQTIPIFTLLLSAIGVACVYATFHFHDKFMLWGQEYIEINEEFLNHKPQAEGDKAFWLKASQLYNIIEELKIAARLQYMPKVYIINAEFMNAFASGYSEKSAMVAVSEGLMDKLTRDELQAVMAHEISHIRHLDIKLTLFIGVLTNIMLFVVDAITDIFFRIPIGGKKDDSGAGNARMVASLILLGLRIFLPIFTLILSLFLSRTREFMADAGSVSLTRDNESLGRALLKIHSDYDIHEYDDEGGKARKAAYIYNPFKNLIATDIMSTHPSVEKRLKAMGLQNYHIDN